MVCSHSPHGVPVARVGRVAVAPVAVDRDRGVGDEVVARDDVGGEVGVGDVAGVDDGDGHAAAGRGVPGAGHAHAGGGLEEVPLLAVLGVVRVGLRLVEAVRHDVGDLRVGLVLGDDVGDIGLAQLLAEVDQRGAGAEAALEVQALAGLLALGLGVGGGCLVRLRLGGARLVADDQPLGRGGHGSGGGLRGLLGGDLGGGGTGQREGRGGPGQQCRGDRGDGYQLPSRGSRSTQVSAFRGKLRAARNRRCDAMRCMRCRAVRSSGSIRFVVEAAGVQSRRREGLPCASLQSGVTCGSAVLEQ